MPADTLSPHVPRSMYTRACSLMTSVQNSQPSSCLFSNDKFPPALWILQLLDRKAYPAFLGASGMFWAGLDCVGLDLH